MSSSHKVASSAFNILKFGINREFVSPEGGAAIEVSAVTDADARQALIEDKPFPQRPLTLGNISLQAEAGKDIRFATDKGQVSFKGSLSAFSGLGLYLDPQSMLDALELDDSIAPGIKLDADQDFYYLMLRWGYDVQASVSGAVALGALGAPTFGASAQKEGVFAVVRRLHKDRGARSAVQDAVSSWKLPGQVESIAHLEPGTWLIAEVDGSFGMKLGAQFGYDFNWVREAQVGGLSGDIGLRLQLGMAVALGFTASGKYAVVLSRDSLDKQNQHVRLRLFKQSKKNWNFAANGGASVQANFGDLLPNKADDFVAAIFGVHGAQIIDELQVIEKWTNQNQDLSSVLPGMTIDYAKQLLKEVTGIDPQQQFEDARSNLLDLLAKWHELDHGAATMLWALAEEGIDFAPIRKLAEQIADSDQDSVRELLGARLREVDFFCTPTGRWFETIVPHGILGVLGDTKEFAGLKKAAVATNRLLDGGSVEKVFNGLHTYVAKRLHVDQLAKVADQASFDQLDEWLKTKLSTFLSEKLALGNLQKINKTIALLLGKRQEFYEKALSALQHKYEFTFAATYQKATTRTALLDVDFDFSQNAATVGEFLQKAVSGDFDALLVERIPGVTLNLATLSHGINRQSHVEVTLPFYKATVDHINSALASVTAVDAEDGRMLVFDLEATDIVTRKSARDSRLAVGALLHSSPDSRVRVHKTDSISYSYSFKQAIKEMRRDQLQYQLKPYVDQYLPTTFNAEHNGRSAGSFDTWIGDLDKTIDQLEHNGTDNFGNTLISLEVSLPANVAGSWLKAPREERSPLYMEMSRGLQAKLKQLIPFYYFADPHKYHDLVPAAVLLVYAAIRPSTSVRLAGGKLTFNTDREVYWNWVDESKRQAMVSNPSTEARLAVELARVHDRLRTIPGMKKDAEFYDPRDQVGRIINTVTKENTGKTILQNLLFVEAEIVRGAQQAGLRLAKFQQEKGSKPTKAVEALTEFGAKVTEVFNKKIRSLYGGEALRPLGTMVFIEAAQALDPGLSNITPNVMLDVTVLKGDAVFPPADFPAHGMLKKEDVVVQERLVELGAGQSVV